MNSNTLTAANAADRTEDMIDNRNTGALPKATNNSLRDSLRSVGARISESNQRLVKETDALVGSEPASKAGADLQGSGTTMGEIEMIVNSLNAVACELEHSVSRILTAIGSL